MRLRNDADGKLTVQVAPLIDVVFLLLIYFMVAAAMIKKEGGLGFKLPAPENGPVLHFPVEARIIIDASGVVSMDGIQFDRSDRRLSGLSDRISGLREMAILQHSAFFVTLDPNENTAHCRVVDVLDACASSKVKNLTFARRDV